MHKALKAAAKAALTTGLSLVTAGQVAGVDITDPKAWLIVATTMILTFALKLIEIPIDAKHNSR